MLRNFIETSKGNNDDFAFNLRPGSTDYVTLDLYQ